MGLHYFQFILAWLGRFVSELGIKLQFLPDSKTHCVWQTADTGAEDWDMWKKKTQKAFRIIVIQSGAFVTFK